MKQRWFSMGLKGIVAAAILFGLLVCFWILPGYGQGTAMCYPEYAWCYYPWLIFLWLFSVPCFAALGIFWKVAGSIGADQPFTRDNARRLKWMERLALGDTVFFFVGNLVMAIAFVSSAPVLFLSLLMDFAGIAIAVACGALSHLVGKAAELQEQSDLTI